jgi:hypothetical protein
LQLNESINKQRTDKQIEAKRLNQEGCSESRFTWPGIQRPNTPIVWLQTGDRRPFGSCTEFTINITSKCARLGEPYTVEPGWLFVVAQSHACSRGLMYLHARKWKLLLRSQNQNRDKLERKAEDCTQKGGYGRGVGHCAGETGRYIR